MNLFDLYAKLTLDTSSYDKAVASVSASSKNLGNVISSAVQKHEALKSKVAVVKEQYKSAQKEVDALRVALNNSVKETGAASDKSQELATKLKEAEQQAAGLKQELDGLNNKSIDTKKIFSGLGSAVTAGLQAVGTVTVAAVGAAATAAGAIVKQAVDSYSQYEQLSDGVRTLFKDSSDAVLENAQKAYSTAGLSANQYMETVTSFSAALIQSTGRGAQQDLEALEKSLEEQYTAEKRHWEDRIALVKDSAQKTSMKRQMEDELKALKEHNKEVLAEAEAMNNQSVTTTESLAEAAKAADRAMIDMSDNANKMGTSMDSLMMAYQGFSKQNYTMLDNLNVMGALAA